MNVKQITEYIKLGIGFYEDRGDDHAIEALQNVLNYINGGSKKPVNKAKELPTEDGAVSCEPKDIETKYIRAVIPTRFDLKKETYEIVNSHKELDIVSYYDKVGFRNVGSATAGIGQNVIYVGGKIVKDTDRNNTLILLEDEADGHPYFLFVETGSQNVEFVKGE